MKKRIMAILLTATMVLEGIGVAPMAASAEEVVTGNTNTSKETAVELTLDEAQALTIEGEGSEAYYRFTPEEAGWYDFYSESASEDQQENDVKATLLDDKGESLRDNDDADGLQFSIKYSLEADKNYYLKVEPVGEGSKSVTVNVKKRQFGAYAGSENVSVQYGGTATLNVVAYTAEGTLSYQWFSYDEEAEEWKQIANATGSSYEITASVGMSIQYECEVTDGFETEICHFYVTVETGLELEKNDVDVKVLYGEKTTLSVPITGQEDGLDLSYSWFSYDEEAEEWKQIANATGSSYEITASAGMPTQYRCEVTDGLKTEICDFYVTVETGLELEKNDVYVVVSYEEKTTLFVSVTGQAEGLDLSYSWFSYDEEAEEWIPIANATGSSYEITASVGMPTQYRCEVTDGLKTETCEFNVEVVQVEEGAFNFTEGMEFTADDFSSEDDQNQIVYKITPEKDMAYRFYSTGDCDPYVNLLDSNLSELASADDSGDDLNFSLSYLLKAGEVYYLAIGVCRMNGTFTVETEELDFVAVTKGDDVTVLYGETAVLEVEAYSAGGDIQYQWYRGSASDEERTKIDGETGSSLQITGDKDTASMYSCDVTDGILTERVCFSVELDTGLEVEAVDTERYLAYGDTTTLSVSATGGMGEIRYQWYYYWDENDYIKITDATKSSLDVIARASEPYCCKVTDGIGTKTSYFNVYLEGSEEFAPVPDLEKVATATLEYTTTIYDGSSKLPKVTVKDGNVAIFEGRDYTVAYSSNTAVGTGTVTITGKGAYTGTITGTFRIQAMSITGAAVTPEATGYTYDGTAKTPAVTVKVGSKVLVSGTDYTVAYSNNTAVGTATITITGKGNYTGTATGTFTITEAAKEPENKPVSLATATVSLAKTGYSYDGKAKTPEVTVKAGKTVLVKDTDYTVSYTKNKNIGTATVTITGKGNYTGTVTKTFTITAKKGTTFTVGSCKYKITGSDTVAFAGLKSSKTKKVTIDKTVKIGGKTFKITSVADKALYKKTKVTSVTIGANVTKIGKSAFEKCSNLKTITIKSTKLKTVGKKALKGIKSSATIKVPAKKLKAYKKLLKGKGQGSKVTIKKA